MEIKVLDDVKHVPCEVLVINKFEGEKTSQELANTYAVDKDHFEGKFGETYLLHTFGQIPADKILVVGFGNKEEFDADKMRLAVSKAVKKLQQIHAKNACFDFDVMCDYGKSAAIGAMIADYAFDKYKTEKATRVPGIGKRRECIPYRKIGRVLRLARREYPARRAQLGDPGGVLLRPPDGGGKFLFAFGYGQKFLVRERDPPERRFERPVLLGDGVRLRRQKLDAPLRPAKALRDVLRARPHRRRGVVRHGLFREHEVDVPRPLQGGKDRLPLGEERRELKF